MKIQYLSVIFIIIILPITIVYSEYISAQATIIKTKEIYDERLLDSTYDALKAFQLNTINTMYYTPENRVKNMQASAQTFLNSLTSAFKYDGQNAKTMNEYVPGVVFTLYDGYYVYSPLTNNLTGTNPDEVDDEYKDGKILNGVKPYVSYSCEFKKGNKRIVISYSLDNYMTVDVYDPSASEKVISHSGYLIEKLKPDGENYKHEGLNVTFSKNDTDPILSEYLNLGNGSEDEKEYFYTVIDGTKYYYSRPKSKGSASIPTPSDGDQIFYIDESLSKHVLYTKSVDNEANFKRFFNEIFHNNSSYKFYKEAYNFTKWVLGATGRHAVVDGVNEECLNLSGLTINDIASEKIKEYITENSGLTINSPILKESDPNVLSESKKSQFNTVKREIIRAVISTNLESAIRGFATYSSSDEAFLMPKIKDSDWDLLENNVCVVTFLQGFRIGGTSYNSYAVVPCSLNKEYVDENDIYILKNNDTYAKATENDVIVYAGVSSLDFKAISRINIEKRKNIKDEYYNPVSYVDSSNKLHTFLASYDSVIMSSKIGIQSDQDIYDYIKSNTTLKKLYLKTLAREKYCSFKYAKVSET